MVLQDSILNVMNSIDRLIGFGTNGRSLDRYSPRAAMDWIRLFKYEFAVSVSGSHEPMVGRSHIDALAEHRNEVLQQLAGNGFSEIAPRCRRSNGTAA